MTKSANPTDPTAAAPAGTAANKPRRGRRFVGLLLAIVMIAGAGGGAWWWWMTRTTAEAHEASDADPRPDESAAHSGAVVTLQPFVVNLADPGGARYLRVSLGLVVAEEDDAQTLEHNPMTMMRVRSAILELLALQTAERLVSPEGKDALKKSIAERVTKVLGRTEIKDVLLSEFIVQF